MNIILLTTLFCFLSSFLFPQMNNQNNANVSPPKILLLHTNTDKQKPEKILRGSGVYKINIFNHLVSQGFNVAMLIVNDPELYDQYNKKGFPVFFLKIENNQRDRNAYVEYLYQLCKKEHINIIHTHDNVDAEAAKKVKRKISIKVATTLHLELSNSIMHLSGVDGVLCVSEKTKQLLSQENERQNLGIKSILFLAPFFDENRFLYFKATRSASDFFKQEYGIQLKKLPLLSMVANFYPNFKDHTTVLKAVYELAQKQHIYIQVAFAGSGRRMNEIKKLAQQLGLEDYVFFLGYTDLIPELYYHSDIAILSSPVEAFGIALLEAAFMKKPLIGTKGTGMESVVKHEKTGLLFEAYNVQDLASCIKKILLDHDYAVSLGNNAYALVQDQYSTQVSIKLLADFYQQVMKG